MSVVRLPPTREAAFRQAVVDAARLLGWRVAWTWNAQHSPKGWPDLVCCRREPSGFVRCVVAELKNERRAMTPEQTEWCDLLRDVAGIEVYAPLRPDQFDWFVREVLR